MEDRLHLDYSIKDPKERELLIEQIIASLPPEKLTQTEIQRFSNYIIDAVTEQEKKELLGTGYKGDIMTDNRMVTISAREVSYEGLVEKFENGEDGVYGLMANNKGYLLTNKKRITQEEIDAMPDLKSFVAEIERVKEAAKRATGKDRYKLNQQLIQMHKDQYDIRASYKPPQTTHKGARGGSNAIKLDDDIEMIDGEPVSKGLISLFNPDHVRAILHDYENLKQEADGQFNNDLYYLMEEVDQLINKVLSGLLYDLFIMKTRGDNNLEIQAALKEKYNVNHSIEYISSLWCQKIPTLLADKASYDYIMWYYTEKERGNWKTCSRCGQTKLAHNRFFSKNNTSKDGYYSICKDCRNEKAQLEKKFGKEYVMAMYAKKKEEKKNGNA